MQSDALLLIRTIGLPYHQNKASQDLSENILLNLFPMAQKNKVSLLFLQQAINISKSSELLDNLYISYLRKSQLTMRLVERTCRTIARTGIDYVIFKTLRPFPSVSVDLDILFFSHEELMEAYKALKKFCRLAGYGSHSITLYDKNSNMNLDLHSEISVSRMIYINKRLLQGYITKIEMNSIEVPVLEPAAELTAVVAHSLFKEQMLTLSDYYTVINHMLTMRKSQHARLIDLVEQLDLGLSLKFALNLISTITMIATKKNISVLAETARLIPVSRIEENMIGIALNQFGKNGALPYRYHPILVALAFVIKSSNDPLTRSTMAQQFVEVIKNASIFWAAVLDHLGN